MSAALDPLVLGAVAAGGVGGAWIRYALLRLALPGSASRRPAFDPRIATLAANLLACLLLGGLLSIDVSAGPPGDLRPLAVQSFGITGVCGSLSTFSTLCAELVGPLRRVRFGPSGLFLLAHLLGGPLALGLGLRLGPLLCARFGAPV